MAGILSFGAYVPRMRLQRSAIYEANRWFAPGLKGLARGARAIANWDEDSVTMAVEAARDCLGEDRGGIDAVLFASTSFPFAERQNAGIVKEALNLSDAVLTADIGGSLKAGTGALLQALRGAGTQSTLVVSADARRARPASEDELLNGDAAAALLVGAGDGVARLVASHSVSIDFVDHFRAEGDEFDYGWETRWVRDEGFAKLGGAAIAGALEAAGLAGAGVTRLIVGIPGKGVAAGLAKQAGIAASAVVDDLSGTLGSAGCAHPLLLLAHSLETAAPGDILLVVGYGHGADALVFEVTEDIVGARRSIASIGVSGWLARGVEETNYLKHLAFAGDLKLELGKRADFEQKPVLTALYRNRKAVMALIGGRCTVTGTVQFPKSAIGVNPNQPLIGTQEDYPLADRAASVVTFTSDSLTYTPDPPNYYGLIDFAGGGRMFAEFTDVDPDRLFVGAPMRMMFRVKARDERSGFIKYFWKAVPAAGSD